MRSFLKAYRLRLPLVWKLSLASCIGFYTGPQGILYGVLELLGPAVRLEELDLNYLVLRVLHSSADRPDYAAQKVARACGRVVSRGRRSLGRSWRNC
jgi:hypothetical protein